MTAKQKIIAHLVHNPTDFHGALAFIDTEQRHLYLNAYQSHLWNRILARWLRLHLRADQLFTPDLLATHRALNRKRDDDCVFYRDLSEDQRSDLHALRLPLPTARTKLDPADSRLTLIEETLQDEDLRLRDLKVKGLREWFFSKGERTAVCLPEGLKWEMADDERHVGNQKMVLGFDLARGSYATLVVARLSFLT